MNVYNPILQRLLAIDLPEKGIHYPSDIDRKANKRLIEAQLGKRPFDYLRLCDDLKVCCLDSEYPFAPVLAESLGLWMLRHPDSRARRRGKGLLNWLGNELGSATACFQMAMYARGGASLGLKKRDRITGFFHRILEMNMSPTLRALIFSGWGNSCNKKNMMLASARPGWHVMAVALSST